MDFIKNDINSFVDNFDLYELKDVKNIFVLKTNSFIFYQLKFELEKYFENVISKYKKIIIFCPEEFQYNIIVKNEKGEEYNSISYFIYLCMQNNIQLFIYSFNCAVNNFFKVKYPNEYSTKILANSPFTLLRCDSSHIIDTENIKKTKKLVFLNYNRKINRDLIITYLKNWNELFKSDNIISYHNNYTIDSNTYKSIYKEYAEKNGIDFEYLDSLKLVPEEVDIHKQNEAQNKAQLLHIYSKFNIVCEPFFGLSDDPTEYEYYNHTISRKFIYPILYNNVIFVHEHSPILSQILKEIGFELFFDNINEFKNNMTDEFYYSDETQKKLNHNKLLLEKYMHICNEKKIPIYRKILKQEIIEFFNK